MVFDVGVAMTWILFLALFPMAFFWLRRAWKIFIKKDYTEVALKRGESPPKPEKWATAVGLLNLGAGACSVWIILGVPIWIATGIEIGPFKEYETWSAMAGSTIWIKIFADYIIKTQAHPFKFGKKQKKSEDK